MSHYVYIIGHCSKGGLESPVKVGITKSLGSRLATLQTGNSQKIEIAFHFAMATREQALFVEAEFHREMTDFRLQGEWFSIDPLYALETLTGIVYDLIERQYNGDDRRLMTLTSNASKNLHIVTTEFWGLPE